MKRKCLIKRFLFPFCQNSTRCAALSARSAEAWLFLDAGLPERPSVTFRTIAFVFGWFSLQCGPCSPESQDREHLVATVRNSREQLNTDAPNIQAQMSICLQLCGKYGNETVILRWEQTRCQFLILPDCDWCKCSLVKPIHPSHATVFQKRRGPMSSCSSWLHQSLSGVSGVSASWGARRQLIKSKITVSQGKWRSLFMVLFGPSRRHVWSMSRECFCCKVSRKPALKMFADCDICFKPFVRVSFLR